MVNRFCFHRGEGVSDRGAQEHRDAWYDGPLGLSGEGIAVPYSRRHFPLRTMIWGILVVLDVTMKGWFLDISSAVRICK